MTDSPYAPTMIFDLQVSPGVLDWPALREIASMAESAGFGAFHVFDHLSGQPIGGSSMIESFTLLGALAEATSAIDLGTMVVNVWNRQVGTLVVAAASVAELSQRTVWLGVGAGAGPGTSWALEQHAAGHHLEPELDRRHERVQDVLDLAAATWRTDRAAEFETFPLPSPTPQVLVGVNSVALSRLAGRSADGINVPWGHPRRDEFLTAATTAAAGRTFLRTAYTTYDAALFDASHPSRREMAERGIERLVLAHFGSDLELPASV